MGTVLNVTLNVGGTVTFAAGTENAGTITAGGAIIFLGDSKNTGSVTSASGTYFSGDSGDTGDPADPDYQAGPVYTVPSAQAYITSNPPLFAHWETNGPFRRVVIEGTRNADQLQAIGASSMTFYGKWQDCPPDGCWTNPASYRPLAPCDYVIDYAYNPNYEVE